MFSSSLHHNGIGTAPIQYGAVCQSVSRSQHMSLADVTYRCDGKLMFSITPFAPAVAKRTRVILADSEACVGVLQCRYWHSCRTMDQTMYTILATNGCPEQFRTVPKMYHSPQSKDTGCADCLQKMTGGTDRGWQRQMEARVSRGLSGRNTLDRR
jgi:hypothetical protein